MHFRQKNFNMDDIDFSYLDSPMRCSTPTPSTDASTIMAGHLDFSVEEDTLNATLDQFANDFTPVEDPDPNENKNTTNEDNFLNSFIDGGKKRSFLSPVMQQLHGSTIVKNVIGKKLSEEKKAVHCN